MTLVIDEVHIKDDLVYDKFDGELIGFIDLGDTNNRLLQFEASLSSEDEPSRPPLANSMLMFMVRSLFSSLTFPYVQFACETLSGDLYTDGSSVGSSVKT